MGEMRASDADRERVVAALGAHLAAGRLRIDEFSDRTDAAYQAITQADLAALTTDLPPTPTAPATVPAGRRGARAAALIVAAVVMVLVVTALAVWTDPGIGQAMGQMMAQAGRMCG